MFDIRMQSILDDLRAALNADRCTLRLDVPGETFPVVHESLGEGAATLVGERTVVLRGQPVVEALLSGVDQVVQEDCPAASDDPAFHAMLAAYGGLSAQIVTAVRDGDRLVGIVSVHVLGGTREWTPLDLGRARRAADDIAQARGMRHRLVLDRDASILADDPGPAHNRLHPDIAPVATIDPGDELEADCRDGMDGELRRAASAEALRDVDLDANHPLTGPVAVRGARAGRRARRRAARAGLRRGRDDGGHPGLRPAGRPLPRAAPRALGHRRRRRALGSSCPASRSPGGRSSGP